uniref:Uncharacterized protein n=1 Tax=Capra hircus TaxID=9925 RepID=A0A452G4U1_CAPHI
MKTHRQREKQGSKVQESTKGPDEAKIKVLLERTGYALDVTTGQRKHGGPPPDSVCPGRPARLLCPWGSPDKTAGVGCDFLLEGSSQPRG